MRSIIYFACPTELIHLHRVIHLMPYQVFTLKLEKSLVIDMAFLYYTFDPDIHI